jgi:outer membrane protein
MNKKNIFRTMALSAVVALATTSCNKQEVATAGAPEQNAPEELKIAFVEIDSVMTQYEFCKEHSLVLEKKAQNIQNTLSQKERDLNAAANNFQQKLQQNAYTREQAEQVQAGLQKQGADLQSLNQRLTNEYQSELEKYNNALSDSIKHFIAAYNKVKKYSLIITKQGENLLYGAPSLDITAEVVAGLNKAYKKTAAKPAEKKTETKPAAKAPEKK